MCYSVCGMNTVLHCSIRRVWSKSASDQPQRHRFCHPWRQGLLPPHRPHVHRNPAALALPCPLVLLSCYSTTRPLGSSSMSLVAGGYLLYSEPLGGQDFCFFLRPAAAWRLHCDAAPGRRAAWAPWLGCLAPAPDVTLQIKSV
jgi:hypothetical protein